MVITLRQEETRYVLENLCRLRYLRPLGGGAQGQVHAVIDPGSHGEVAVKLVVVPWEARGADDAVRRIWQEYEILRGADASANLLRVFEIRECRYQHYYCVWFSMELCQGTVAQLLTDMPLTQRIKRGFECLEGIAYLHHCGVSHRDIKLTNLLIDRRGRLKIGDFGTAKKINPAHYSEADRRYIVGTPEYIAPEMLLARTGDILLENTLISCDQYSLGVTLYQILTCGQLPTPLKSGGPQVGPMARLSQLSLLYDRLRNEGRNPFSPLQIPERPGDPLEKTSKMIEKMISIQPQERFATLTRAALDLMLAMFDDNLLQAAPEE